MSAQRISLNSKPVIATVLVLLAVVVVINVAIFQPGKKAPVGAQVRVQSSQPMPIDLGGLRLETETPEADLAAWEERSLPPLERDPFGKKAPDRPVYRAKNKKRVVSDRSPLQCNAILLGGLRPVAMINGKSYTVGDRCGKYEVAAIGNTGVKLKSGSGPGLFLSVLAIGERASRVVTGMTNNGGPGKTSLAEHAQGERK